MAYEILDRIRTPEELRALSEHELNTLCGEIRAFLLEHVSKTGGHLASNLGAVELTAAIHRVYDSSRDRIVPSYCIPHFSITRPLAGFRTSRCASIRCRFSVRKAESITAMRASVA